VAATHFECCPELAEYFGFTDDRAIEPGGHPIEVMDHIPIESDDRFREFQIRVEQFEDPAIGPVTTDRNHLDPKARREHERIDSYGPNAVECFIEASTVERQESTVGAGRVGVGEAR
jgi:hypothetical protein